MPFWFSFFFSSRRRHTRCLSDWSSDVCSSDLAASGAVGSIVGQLAKIWGARAIGIAGGREKCSYVKEELGFDACIDYKAGELREQLKERCPNGVDVYFDNVGGEILDTLLTRMNLFGRVVVCGSIADYNAVEPYRVR